MEIILGKSAGFCYGVKRAVEGAKKELEKSPKQIYCLGEIVHNKHVVEELEEKGMSVTEDITKAREKVIIRAHGVTDDIYKYAKENNLEIIDFTCPNVLRIHEIAKEYAKNGYYIFLCGNKKHPENIGTLSYCGKNVSVIEDETQIEDAISNFKKSKIEKILIIVQTTYSVSKFEFIENKIKEILSSTTSIVVKNTICPATELRQNETKEISKDVECMIIIGGKNSSNTKKLYEISKQNCENSICIESVQDIDITRLKEYSKIGIMAGASTPQKEIKKVVELIEKIDN